MKEKHSKYDQDVQESLQNFDSTITQLFGIKQPEKSIAFDETSIINRLENIVKFVAKIYEEKNTETSESLTLDDYNKLYQIIKKPAISDRFTEDLIFAYLQVAGPNPLVLEQFTQMDSRLPITPEQYQAIAKKFGVTDSLSKALTEGRLYASDYKLLDGLPNGNFINDNLTQQKYISAPIALFNASVRYAFLRNAAQTLTHPTGLLMVETKIVKEKFISWHFQEG
ncbi:MAG: hypothetical protein F6K23_13340 [Okeania sp. SIO2C9]|uniref:hypothetical protein n=1 Tax=Okeania sp. SIO2C9 TaxID=2607791 RepID=UPI0013C0E60D|nr:hypothetical protein [Okeania sp. SIO2C9]NEQ73946.1 hypothetical protein [Okeania sp. SIO2C9]